MGKVTRVFNDTEAVIELKQGSANVFHLLHSLPKKKSYDIKVDESATYREYWCAVQPIQPDNTTAERVVFSSDDCAEFSKVRIYKDDHGKYAWEGTVQRGTWRNTPVASKNPPPASTSVDPTSTSTPVPTPVHKEETLAWWQHVTGWFKKKN